MRFSAVAVAALATGALAHWKKPVDDIESSASLSLPAPTGPAPSSSAVVPPAESSSAAPVESTAASSVTTEVIDVYTTVCPGATTLTLGTQTYSVTGVCIPKSSKIYISFG